MELIGHSRHLGCGRQISLPKNEIAIPISFHISFGSTFINCFSALIPSLVSWIKPILGATRMTCKSAIIPCAGIFASWRITFADFLPMPFKAIKFSILSEYSRLYLWFVLFL